MRISTDDGRFGLILTPAGDPWDARFFRFQLIVDSIIMGDSEPCILGSMMLTLQNMARLEDPRLAQPDADPAATLSVLRSDAALNDPSLLGAAESLDHCLVRGYVHGTNAIVIGEPAEPPVGTRTPHVAVMSLHDFQAVVAAAAHYWEEVQCLALGGERSRISPDAGLPT